MRDTIFEKNKFIYRVSYFKTSIIDLNVQNNTHLYKYSYQMFIHCHDKFRKIIGKNITQNFIFGHCRRRRENRVHHKNLQGLAPHITGILLSY